VKCSALAAQLGRWANKNMKNIFKICLFLIFIKTVCFSDSLSISSLSYWTPSRIDSFCKSLDNNNATSEALVKMKDNINSYSKIAKYGAISRWVGLGIMLGSIPFYDRYELVGPILTLTGSTFYLFGPLVTGICGTEIRKEIENTYSVKFMIPMQSVYWEKIATSYFISAFILPVGFKSTKIGFGVTASISLGLYVNYEINLHKLNQNIKIINNNIQNK
jgi:hypothetical protein